MSMSIRPAPFGCTDFQFKIADQTPICGRNMDFPNIEPMQSRLSVHPIGEKWTSSAPNNAQGFSWEVKIGFVGISAFSDSTDPSSVDDVVDGLNQQGLSGAVLTLNASQYQQVPQGSNDRAISQMDLLPYLLSTCASVQEVTIALQDLYVWGAPFAPFPAPPGLHYAFHDKAGNNLVIEFINGAPQCTLNPIGVLTNDPIFPVQLASLAQYANISALPLPNTVINGVTIPSPGMGSGTLGLSASTDASSRFATTTKLIELTQQNALPQNIDEGIRRAHSLLGRVHVIKGEKIALEGPQQYLDRTIWSVIKVLGEQLQLIYFSESDPNLKSIMMGQIDFSITGSPRPKVPVSTPLSMISVEHQLCPFIEY